MKILLSHFIIIFIFCVFLLFPVYILQGAADGLILWYNYVLPNLLPFIIITTLMIQTKAYELLSNCFEYLLSGIFHVTKEGSLAIIIGFLCGYPMGAKVINDLYEQTSISKKEAQYLLSFCNNTSPMFILSFFILQLLSNPNLLPYALLALYGAPICVSFISRKFYHIPVPYKTPKCSSKSLLKGSIIHRNASFTTNRNSNNKGEKLSFQLLDTIMIDSIILIMKIGGYIMLFSIFIELSLWLIETYYPIFWFMIPLLEITNGLTMYQQIGNPYFQYLAMIFLISFGGFCSIGQTTCVLKSSDFNIFHYFIAKIITAIIAVIISVILLFFYS